jgi:hypothetical protein
MRARAPAIKSQPGGLYMRKPYVSFTYKLPLTSSCTGGGPAGFAGAVTVAGAGTGAGHFVAATGGAFFAAFGAAGAVAGVMEGAPVVGTAADADVVAGLLAGAAAGALVAGVEALVVDTDAAGGTAATGGTEEFVVSFFAVFTGSAVVGGLDTGAGDAGALLALDTGAAGADATAVSVLAGFGGATGFSVVGSGFFSLSGFAGASDMLIETT